MRMHPYTYLVCPPACPSYLICRRHSYASSSTSVELVMGSPGTIHKIDIKIWYYTQRWTQNKTTLARLIPRTDLDPISVPIRGLSKLNYCLWSQYGTKAMEFPVPVLLMGPLRLIEGIGVPIQNSVLVPVLITRLKKFISWSLYQKQDCRYFGLGPVLNLGT